MSVVSRRTPPPAAADRLVRALRLFLGEDLEVEQIDSRRWTSITFAGERHQLALLIPSLAGSTAEAIAARLADAELDIPGHVLVDLTVTAVEQDQLHGTLRLGLQAVTLESP